MFFSFPWWEGVRRRGIVSGFALILALYRRERGEIVGIDLQVCPLPQLPSDRSKDLSLHYLPSVTQTKRKCHCTIPGNESYAW
jgi:hypothetical protein